MSNQSFSDLPSQQRRERILSRPEAREQPNSQDDWDNRPTVMLPAWLGQHNQPIRPYLLTQAFGGSKTLAIRLGNWKFIDHANSGGNRYENNPQLQKFILRESAPNAPGQLYDLNVDPGETNNLYYQQPTIAKELKELLESKR